ncbi:MAG: HAD family hydrolase [Lachnospiraceae bacterium]|nr:HAD family hydrolase [Lachnospiraceae bacterium]
MDAIFLDIDGTLWDSTYTVAKAWNKVLETKPNLDLRVTPERLKQLFGKPLAEIAANLFPDFPKEMQLQLIDDCCKNEHELLEQEPGIIFEGVVETIRSLSCKYPVCIVSNCEAGYIELVTKMLGITDCITDFECPGYSGLSKGENILRVMERNHYKKVVYVGDTQGDYEACLHADVPFIYCKYGFGTPKDCDISIEKFGDLLNLDFFSLF